MAATLEALRRAASGEERPRLSPNPYHIFNKVLAMTFAHKKIAASVLLAVGALAAWTTLGLFGSVTYADVADKIRQMHSMTCTSTTTLPDLKDPVVAKIFYRDQGQTRAEGPLNLVMISDVGTGQFLTLDTASRKATLVKIDMAAAPPSRR